jgi:hypothetical protein
VFLQAGRLDEPTARTGHHLHLVPNPDPEG